MQKFSEDSNDFPALYVTFTLNFIIFHYKLNKSHFDQKGHNNSSSNRVIFSIGEQLILMIDNRANAYYSRTTDQNILRRHLG